MAKGSKVLGTSLTVLGAALALFGGFLIFKSLTCEPRGFNFCGILLTPGILIGLAGCLGVAIGWLVRTRRWPGLSRALSRAMARPGGMLALAVGGLVGVFVGGWIFWPSALALVTGVGLGIHRVASSAEG